MKTTVTPMLPGILRDFACTRAALLLLGTVACGPIDDTSAPPERLATQAQELETDNGVTFNGLAFNGLAFNGLAFNGLAFNGLSSAAFSTWFDQNTALADTVMRYVIACAVPAHQTRTYTASNGTVYTWKGSLGLAPDWAEGQPATQAEQQLVSGCLAGHVNKFGRKVAISMLGRTGRGQPLASPTQELQEFSLKEGAFGGNLFTHEGVFSCNDSKPLSWYESSVRACALGQGDGACEPIDQIGSCAQHCKLDPTGTYYTQCTRDGVSYAVVTTRMHPADVYSCGDGTCQFTEGCGLGASTSRCGLDCGLLCR